MSQKILVFAGKKQSGKSSAANFVAGYILAQLGRKGQAFCPVSFAIDDDGELNVNTAFMDANGDPVETEGILNLNRHDEDFTTWASNVMWPYVKPYAFADSLKWIAMTVFNIDSKLLYGTDEEKNQPTHIKWKDMCQFLSPKQVASIKKSEKYDKFMTVREFLQYFGTNVCRVLDDECWTRKCFSDILSEGSELAIIQDCRFANEVHASYKLKEIYGVDVKVVKLLRSGEFDIHESENGLKGIADTSYDLVIDNEHMTIKEKNQEILDALYTWGWLSGHIGLEV